MEEIISKGYGKESQATPKDGREWYLPHRGVYNPNKPEEIRVEFSCSTEFNGRSINKELILGPDLVNQLVSVLTREQTGIYGKYRENVFSNICC